MGHDKGETVESLGEALPKEMARAREVLGIYKSIGPAGAFGATMIEQLLQRADKAVMEQDIVAMIQVYQELKAVE